MKNLYKIEDELYIISNNEAINENDHIITQDGRLVEVSYLLSKDVQGGHKVILTTNKLLIKDGVQPIDDEFLEFIVKNPSCESVEVESLNIGDGKLGYVICKPKEKHKQETENLKNFKKLVSNETSGFMKDFIKEKQQETIEEAAEKANGYNVYAKETKAPIFKEGFIEGAKWQQQQNKNLCSDEEVLAFGKSCFYKGFNKAENDDANCYTAFREEIGKLFNKFKKK